MVNHGLGTCENTVKHGHKYKKEIRRKHVKMVKHGHRFEIDECLPF